MLRVRLLQHGVRLRQEALDARYRVALGPARFPGPGAYHRRVRGGAVADAERTRAARDRCSSHVPGWTEAVDSRADVRGLNGGDRVTLPAAPQRDRPWTAGRQRRLLQPGGAAHRRVRRRDERLRRSSDLALRAAARGAWLGIRDVVESAGGAGGEHA